ncbi:hypothetical protein C8Q70DRAFT_1037301 [Cubamyces menziesii]|nr:hypothetical protein C8Q70DRAFT_1037301 [Cubamyces menziesii]
MYEWYAVADTCFVYMEDVSDEENPCLEDCQFGRSRWFTRGWTLQELIAPRAVVFLSKEWRYLGTKASLGDAIQTITGIPEAILNHVAELDSVSVAQRMSWASRRQTTREEDQAYSLMGIFGIHMPTIYGEGQNAFVRLQEEVLRTIPDQSIFLWDLDSAPSIELAFDSSLRLVGPAEVDHSQNGLCKVDSTLFAPYPSAFVDCPRVSPRPFSGKLDLTFGIPEYTVTSYGLRTRLPLVPIMLSWYYTAYLGLLECEDPEGDVMALLLQPPPPSSSMSPGWFSVGHQFVLSDTPGSPPLSSHTCYVRFVGLSPDMLQNVHDTIKLTEICIPLRWSHLPPALRPTRSPSQPRHLPTTRSITTVVIPTWVTVNLKKAGFDVTLHHATLNHYHTEVLRVTDQPAEPALLLQSRNVEISIYLWSCPCPPHGNNRRWESLCVSVSPNSLPSQVFPEGMPWERLFLNPYRCPANHIAEWPGRSQDFEPSSGLRIRLTLTPCSAPTDERISTYILGVELRVASGSQWDLEENIPASSAIAEDRLSQKDPRRPIPDRLLDADSSG